VKRKTKKKRPVHGLQSSGRLYQHTSRPVRFQDKELLGRLQMVANHVGKTLAELVTWLTARAFAGALVRGSSLNRDFKLAFPVQRKQKPVEQLRFKI
jgi:hypothetical protein